MDEFIKQLDSDLQYVSHEIVDDIYHIYVESIRKEVKCPFCGEMSSREHSRYVRSFQDLPIQGKKVIIYLDNRKMFCDNPECSHKTFAERFTFINDKAKKTKRLEDEIVRLSLNVSSVAASEYLSGGIAEVGKSTICALLKKRRGSNR